MRQNICGIFFPHRQGHEVPVVRRRPPVRPLAHLPEGGVEAACGQSADTGTRAGCVGIRWSGWIVGCRRVDAEVGVGARLACAPAPASTRPSAAGTCECKAARKAAGAVSCAPNATPTGVALSRVFRCPCVHSSTSSRKLQSRVQCFTRKQHPGFRNRSAARIHTHKETGAA